MDLPRYFNCNECGIAIPFYLILNKISPWEEAKLFACLKENGEITVTCPNCHEHDSDEYRI